MDRSNATIGACILVGGLSQRMGRDKARLTLGRRTFLSHIRDVASAAGFPVRIIRKDLVPRRGPVGGIYTGLLTSPHQAELFLACDMPFVSAEWLKELADVFRSSGEPVVTKTEAGPGFPLIVPTRYGLFDVVRGSRSIRSLVEAVAAQVVSLRLPLIATNINTPTQLAQARKLWQERRAKA